MKYLDKTGLDYLYQKINDSINNAIIPNPDDFYNKTEVDTSLSSKAPVNHASTATTYGIGTSALFGHVKVNDSYITSAGAAANGVAASSKAVYDAYTTLANSKADIGAPESIQCDVLAGQGNIVLWKNDFGMVTLLIQIAGLSGYTASVLHLGTIPYGYRPGFDIVLSGICQLNGANPSVAVIVYSSGEIKLGSFAESGMAAVWCYTTYQL